MRSSALVTRGLPYVEAAKVQGAGSGRILWKLILPSVISPLTVQASFIFAQAIISEAVSYTHLFEINTNVTPGGKSGYDVGRPLGQDGPPGRDQFNFRTEKKV